MLLYLNGGKGPLCRCPQKAERQIVVRCVQWHSAEQSDSFSSVRADTNGLNHVRCFHVVPKG